VAEDDHAGLERLVRQPDGTRRYHELLDAGELVGPRRTRQVAKDRPYRSEVDRSGPFLRV
jgi:hypothetical protein